MPVLRSCRVAPGFCFPITRERAARCTPCFPLVFPSQFHGLQKFCAEMDAWLQLRMFRVWISTHTGRVVRPSYVTGWGSPALPLLEKRMWKRCSEIPLTCRYLSLESPSLLPSLLLTHWPQYFKASCVLFQLCNKLSWAFCDALC